MGLLARAAQQRPGQQEAGQGKESGGEENCREHGAEYSCFIRAAQQFDGARLPATPS